MKPSLLGDSNTCEVKSLWWVLARGSGKPFPLILLLAHSFYTPTTKNCLEPNQKLKNNFWQRISWLSQRWRTQRIAISNVNCIFRESLNLWTHIALFGTPKSMSVWESVQLSFTLLGKPSTVDGTDASRKQFLVRWILAKRRPSLPKHDE
jgi:hypothetical protein